MLSTLEPVTSIIVGVLAYHEGFTVKTIIGTVCILSSTLLVARSASDKSTGEIESETAAHEEMNIQQ